MLQKIIHCITWNNRLIWQVLLHPFYRWGKWGLPNRHNNLEGLLEIEPISPKLLIQAFSASHAESDYIWLIQRTTEKCYRIRDFCVRDIMSIQSRVLWNQCCNGQHLVSVWWLNKTYRILPCTSHSWQPAFHWENSVQLCWGFKYRLCFAFVPNTAAIIGKNCQNTFIRIVKRKQFLKSVALPTAPTSYISRWKRQVEFCLKKINRLALMEVINANCLAREIDFSFLVGIP